ncbi:unnamed protein product [Bemisia tabaci]|uniref:Uncharacterized protein n=1 Tax=Bemisia tabaci TaxID=7038 RepID=A0A9P0AG76_BEMTA|nr:unnamed protein product [Bemisia tabaci]
MSAIYGVFLIFTHAYWKTTFLSFFLTSLGLFSVTAGCHRLWAHRTYEAVWPLRLALVIFQTLVCQGPVYDWVLDHRLHHKHHGTEEDPYNHKKGFFYGYLGNRLVTQNPKIDDLKAKIDMSDIEDDQIVMWQKRLYWIMMPLFSILLPINAPVEYWGESILVSVFVVGFLRVTLCLHGAWMVNTAFLVWGLDPLNKRSADTNLVFLVNKSLWPQYHYLLPWDYQSGEYGTYGDGCTTAFIRIFTVLGLADRLKTIDSRGVRSALGQTAKTGKPLLECLQMSQDVLTGPHFVPAAAEDDPV